MIYIGIDGGTHTGVAVYDTWRKRFIELATGPASMAVDMCAEYDSRDNERVIAVVEDPSANKPVFSRHGANERAMLKIAQNVGAVKQQTNDLIARLKEIGIEVQTVPPRKSKKIDKAYFRSITGYEGRTSQHSRDAAMLVFQKPVPPDDPYLQTR